MAYMVLKLWFPAADVIADTSLVVVPLHLWKNVGLSRGRKILIISTISSSILITVITIPHSIVLFRTRSRSTLIFAHIKASTFCSPRTFYLTDIRALSVSSSATSW